MLPGLKRFEVHELRMIKTATFGPEINLETGREKYRYDLGRDWMRGFRETITFVALNPSTATHEEDDPTIRREIGFSKDWGFKRMLKTNIFAYRSTDPKRLYDRPAPEIIGPANDQMIEEIAEQAEMVMVCWGNHGALHRRDRQVCSILSKFAKKVYCFGMSKTGQPLHPLYLPSTTRPIQFFIDPGPIHTKEAKPWKEKD